MSSDPFPARVDLPKLFAKNGEITAALPLARLQRLQEYLADNQGQVMVDLKFGHDQNGRRLLSGSLDATVNVICQRCLQQMPLDLHSNLHLLVVDTDAQLEALDDSEDGIVIEEGEFDLPELIEDELILSLPLVPVHDDVNCNSQLNAIREKSSEIDASTRQNPFAVLAAIKAGKENEDGSDLKAAKSITDKAGKQDKKDTRNKKDKKGKKDTAARHDQDGGN